MNFQFSKGFKNCFIKTMTENRKTEALMFEAKEMHNFLFAILQLVNLISFLFWYTSVRIKKKLKLI